MKLFNRKLLTTIILVLAVSVISLPDYEIPTIVHHDQPFNQPYNARIDNINDSSANNYERYLGRKLKVHLNSEMGRNASIKSFQKWLDFYESENLKELTLAEMIDNISNILGKSIHLQNFINLKSGLVVKLLGLMDMKLKQITVLDDTMKNIEFHPSDINMNAGNNLIWKANLEELFDVSAAENNLYNLNWNSMCEAMALKGRATQPVVSSKHVKKPHITRRYHPEQEFLLDKNGVDHNADDSKAYPTPSIRDVKDLERGKEELQKEQKNNQKQASFVEKNERAKSKSNTGKAKTTKITRKSKTAKGRRDNHKKHEHKK